MNGNGFTLGMTGRADLVRARRLGDPELEEYIASLLGYRVVAPEPRPRREPATVTPDGPTPEPPSPAAAGVTHDIPFWQPNHFAIRARRAAEPDGIAGEVVLPTDPLSRKPPKPKPATPRFSPLSSNASLLTRLRAASPNQEVSGEIDVDRIVEEWGRGRFLASMPRSSRKSWGRTVQVFVDRSRRLIPYWEDQTLAYLAIRELYSPEGFSLVVLPEGHLEPTSMKIGRQALDYQLPPPGSVVVALSDLGALNQRGAELVALWAERGKRLLDLGVKPQAVVPYRRGACPKELSRYWTILPWETSTDAPAIGDEEAKAIVQQILTLLSFTVRIEPQLIRFVRRLLPAGRGEPGIESWVWQDEAFGDPHCEAAELSPDKVDLLRAALSGQDSALRKLVYERAEAHHANIYEGVWHAESANLSNDDLITTEQRRATYEWFESLEESLKSKNRSDKMDAVAAWQREVSDRFLNVAYQDRGRLGRVLHRLWYIVHRDDPGAVLPDGADLSLLPLETERCIELRQLGDRLIASYPFHDGTLRDGSPLALLRTSQSRLKIEPFDDFWQGGVAPAWADGWGRDEFGPWVDLRVDTARQRLRWMPKGKFWMGSPDSEEGRWEDEGPRHEETIPSGFWMFDTPCTQALWETVTGENPSKFKGPDRPVESVSWDQCQEFVKRLNESCDGLELKLPTEAQWEYACRAGTETPRYREDLNEIAWCFENSDGATHPVGRKAPNEWGLYDTLGNVYEWCEDVWTDDYRTEKKAATLARRVIRGGSWVNDARLVRAAYRYRIAPSDRNNGLGFRCAEFRAPGPVDWNSRQEAERARERGAGRAEHPEDRDHASGAAWINLDAPGRYSVSFAALTPLRISSDVEQVVLRTITRPKWASAIGRDKYGLWAEFTIERKVAKTKRGARKKRRAPPEAPLGPVRQRLRWIPPGRFLMGSPPDEEGRFSREGPQHEVTFTEGFWMFDTPCTQALWEAILGTNPSVFQSTDRPVESVTWKDCHEFVGRLNEKVELSLSLPSEAQWEYACRAGTTEATYAGSLKAENQNNPSNLDGIAWYGGNSGIDFELSNGYDASGWPEKQFEFDKAGTHPVARMNANPWGLYDMLGNVWEWCDDLCANDYTEESRAEAAAADPASAPRVIRGASWRNVALVVRAAYRSLHGPLDRDSDLGFRCAQFRQGVVSGAKEGSEAEGADAPEDREPMSAAARSGEGAQAQPN